MLARDLIAEAPDTHQIIERGRNDVDVTSTDAVSRAVHDAQPDLIVNAAAYTNDDGAYSASDQAFAVNGTAPGIIGTAARHTKTPVVLFSTDYVFDGEEFPLCPSPP